MINKPLIMIVDDQLRNIELLEAYLLPEGYDIVMAASGEEALIKLSSASVDLILLDIVMTGMTGYEACKKIKVNSRTAFLPIIMLTSLDTMESKITGLEAGADDFLNKPVHKIELLARVKNLLKIKFLHDEVESRNKLISSMLHRYVNDSVITQILSNPGKYSELGGDKKEVAAFFCDIRGFTPLSENMNADQLINFLNSIYKELVGIVFKNNGTLDKYMGDCIMAFWGAPTNIENETLWAIRAAQEMQEAFENLKHGWPLELKQLGLGIGINYGEVVAGNIGTEKVMDYTIIGDVVNTAQRLESIADSGQILITKTALSRVEGKIAVKTLPAVQLKGKVLPVEIYEVLKN